MRHKIGYLLRGLARRIDPPAPVVLHVDVTNFDGREISRAVANAARRRDL